MTSKSKQLSDFPNKIPYDNTESGLTATTVQGAIDEIVVNPGEVANYYTATVEGSDGTSDWTRATGSDPWIAVVTVAGLLTTDRPTVGLDLSGVDLADIVDTAAAFQTVYRVEATDNDELTLYATSEPAPDFDLLIQVVR